MVAKEQKVAEVRVSRCIDLLGLSSQLGFILSNVSFVNKLAPTRISFFFKKNVPEWRFGCAGNASSI